jgi:hypothetical protein
VASSEPSYTKTVYTQLLPFSLLSAFPPHGITNHLLTDVNKQNAVQIVDVYDGEVKDFILVWLPILILIPSFGCFMTVPVNLNDTRWLSVSLLHCSATVQNA